MEEKILVWKTRGEWIKQAKEAMDKAKVYGVVIIDDMREPEKSLLRQSLDALGMNVQF